MKNNPIGVFDSGIGGDVKIIDSAKPTSQELHRILSEKDLLNDSDTIHHEFFMTDITDRIFEIATNFFGHDIKNDISRVTLS